MEGEEVLAAINIERAVEAGPTVATFRAMDGSESVLAIEGNLIWCNSNGSAVSLVQIVNGLRSRAVPIFPSQSSSCKREELRIRDFSQGAQHQRLQH